MSEILRSTSVLREFQRIQTEFENVIGQEEALTLGFVCLDTRIAEFVDQERIHRDEEILQALSAVGLQAYARLTRTPLPDWRGLSEPVRALAESLATAFDPAMNPELAVASVENWTSDEDESHHYARWGSVIRRLVVSVRQRSKRDPHGYCRFILGFIKEAAGEDQPPLPSNRWVLWGLSAKEGTTKALSSHRALVMQRAVSPKGG